MPYITFISGYIADLDSVLKFVPISQIFEFRIKFLFFFHVTLLF